MDEPSNYVNLNNETATDRGTFDTISPESDASINPFEKDPNDSVDITEPGYNDAKAQEIEASLEPKVNFEEQ